MRELLLVLVALFVLLEAVRLGLWIASARMFGLRDALRHVEFDLADALLFTFLAVSAAVWR